jgi:hypothetical protein
MEKHPVVANGGPQWPAESTPAVARRVEPAGKPLGGDNDGAGRQAGRAFGASTLGEAVTAGRNRRYTGGHGTVQFGGGRKRGLQIRESRIPPPSPVGLEVELNRQSPKRFGAGVVPGGDGSGGTTTTVATPNRPPARPPPKTSSFCISVWCGRTRASKIWSQR